MTVYARSDVMSVALSKHHGGCGAVHARPVTHGAPATVWALDCRACEDHLRGDPRWAASPAEVPETPDEIRIREEREKKGELDRSANLETAVQSLAASQDGMQRLLTIMATMLANNPAMAQALAAANSGDTPGATASAPAEDLAALPLDDLKARARQRGLPVSGSRAQLLDRLAAAS
jgi:hypothetical protein